MLDPCHAPPGEERVPDRMPQPAILFGGLELLKKRSQPFTWSTDRHHIANFGAKGRRGHGIQRTVQILGLLCQRAGSGEFEIADDPGSREVFGRERCLDRVTFGPVKEIATRSAATTISATCGFLTPGNSVTGF